MEGMKYVVTVGNETQVFFDRRTAEEWFSANWMHGMSWEFHLYHNGTLVY